MEDKRQKFDENIRQATRTRHKTTENEIAE